MSIEGFARALKAVAPHAEIVIDAAPESVLSMPPLDSSAIRTAIGFRAEYSFEQALGDYSTRAGLRGPPT